MIQKIYIFGNSLIQEDSLPLKLIEKLKKNFPKIEFVYADPNENFPPKGEKELIIIDTVKGIKEPMILQLDDFESKKNTPISPHDYDLLFHLLLLKKTKKINKVKVIGVPNRSQFSLSSLKKLIKKARSLINESI